MLQAAPSGHSESAAMCQKQKPWLLKSIRCGEWLCRLSPAFMGATAAFAERPPVTAFTLHIAFSDPAAESLKKGLHNAGRTDRVVCNNFDNLALGPINPPDLQTRLHLMEEELSCSGWEWVHAEEEAFWKAALAEDVRRVAWMSR